LTRANATLAVAALRATSDDLLRDLRPARCQ